MTRSGCRRFLKVLFFNNIHDMTGIYKITSPTNKVYIGQSVNIERRFYSYLKPHNCKKQPRLFNSFVKHGVQNHIFQIIKECLITELNYFERLYQDFYDCIGINGLNCVLTKSTDRSGILSIETINKRKSTCKEKKLRLIKLIFKNEIRNDLYTQTEYAKKIGTSVPYVNKLIRKEKLNIIAVNGATLIKV